MRLSVDVASSSVKAGSPILLKIQLKNLSSQTVHMSDFGDVFNYHVRVLDAAGKEGPKTELGERLFQDVGMMFSKEVPGTKPGEKIRIGPSMPISIKSLTLAPGEVWVDTLDLTKIYVLPPGVYQGQLSYTVEDRDGKPRTNDPLVVPTDERAFANGFTIVITK
ncbi:MAG: hypothetical protein ABI824_02805 [Acidobacteriota bacterium]